MRTEALQAPEVVAQQLDSNANRMRDIGLALRESPPQAILTLARGSSDHAASYAAYLLIARLGTLVASLPMSLAQLYAMPKPHPRLWAMGFSQSGQSPDLLNALSFFAHGQSPTLAFVNDAASPLAQAARWLVPLHAGPERSIAATKSLIAQLVAAANLAAHWAQDATLISAVNKLPQTLVQAAQADWSAGVEALHTAESLYVLARGTGLGIAKEAALKFKETCGIHAEAFSSAEVQHGPMALVRPGFPILVFAPKGPAQSDLLQTAAAMRARGAQVLLAAPAGTPHANLHIACSAHPDLDPISAIQSFYPMVEALARARGMNPDEPRHLNKVTLTH